MKPLQKPLSPESFRSTPGRPAGRPYRVKCGRDALLRVRANLRPALESSTITVREVSALTGNLRGKAPKKF